MPILGPALGYLPAMYNPGGGGWGGGDFCAFDRNDLPTGREFDGQFLENVKPSPHAFPSSAGFTVIGA